MKVSRTEMSGVQDMLTSSLEAKPLLRGSTISELISKYYDNRLTNLGNHDSFIWYGPRWAQAATAPSRLYKGYSTEGGIRVPCVVRYPKLFKQPGQIVRAFANVMDIMPTFLELAGIKHPAAGKKKNEKAPWRKRVVYPMMGKSWVGYFTNAQSKSTVDG
jgi:arylsulfatase